MMYRGGQKVVSWAATSVVLLLSQFGTLSPNMSVLWLWSPAREAISDFQAYLTCSGRGVGSSNE